MYLASRESTVIVDKENAGTPARIKMLTGQNTPVGALKTSKLATPSNQQCTPGRRPLMDVNHDLSGSTPGRMLSKPVRTPHLQGTPKMMTSKTPGRKSTSLRKSVSCQESQKQWNDNLYAIADELTSHIMREELKTVFKEVQMKYTSSATTQAVEDDTSIKLDTSPSTCSKVTQQTPVCQLTDSRVDGDSSTTNVSSHKSDGENHQTHEEQFVSDNTGRVEDTYSDNREVEPQVQSGDSAELVSLLDPLKDWTFHSDVSLVTPVKMASLSRKPDTQNDMYHFMGELYVDVLHLSPSRDLIDGDTSSEMIPVRNHDMSSAMTPVGYREISSEMTPTKCQDMSSEMTPVRCHEMSSQMTPVGQREIASGVTPILHREMSSEITPIRQGDMSSQMTPVQHREMASAMTPVGHHDIACEMTPIRNIETSSQMTPVKHREVASEMTPVRHSEMSSQMTPVQHVEMASEMTPVGHHDIASEITPVRFGDMSCQMTPIGQSETSSQMTPIQHREMASEITPVQHSEISCQMTPIQNRDMASEMTPVQHREKASEMTPIRHSETSSQMTPVQHKETSSEMTPVKHDTTSTCMTPVRLVDGFSETSRVELIDTASDPIPMETTNLGTMTSPVKVAHVEVGTEQVALVHTEVGTTPVQTKDSSCAMTPHQMTDKATSITPVVRNEMETETSPMVIPVYRWEAENQQTADPVSLLGHLETASISNQLLRREVQMWTERHASISQQLSKAREDLKKKRVVQREEDQKVNQMHSLAKVTREKDVEDLMSQIGEQMMQIGELQNQLDKKSKEIDTVHQEKTECQEQYQKEVHNLQKDLKTAYRQHQEQIAELEDQVKRNNYKPHYERAQQTIHTLQAEIEAYSGLHDAMQRATKLQEEFGCLEDAFSNVMKLYQKTVTKKQVWQTENKAMQAQMETNQQQMLDAQSQLHKVETDRNQLQAEIKEVKEIEETTQRLNNKLTADIESANATIEELKKQLHVSKLEALGFQEDYKKSTSQCKELEEASIAAHIKEQSLEASLLVQENQWKDAQIQMDNTKKSLHAKIGELEQQCQGLSNSKAELEKQFNIVEECRSVLDADLTISRNTVEEQWSELESLRHQTGQMKEQIKDLQDSSDFLEQERQSLVDACKESDDNLRVTTLELSRCKVALEESESARKQWESAVEDISEKLQETQLELDNTKAYAHYMLLNQGSEMNDAGQGLHAIQQEMDTVMLQLKDTLGIDLSKERDISPIKNPSASCSMNNTSTSSDASSIVASVLNALQIKGSSTPKDNSSIPASPLVGGDGLKQNVSDYEHQEMTLADSITESYGSNIVIGQSGSAFTSVRNSSNSSSCNRTPVQPKESRTNVVKSEKNTGPVLVDQVGQVGKLFGLILRGLITYANGLNESLQEIKEDRDRLQKNVAKSRHNFESELTLVQEQLQASQCSERALQQQLANSKAKLCDLEQDLQYGEQRTQVMANNLARFSDQKYTIEKLRQDVKDLTATCKASEMEKAAMQQVLDDLVSKVNSDDEGHKGSQVYGAVVKENCKLKMEIERMRLKAIERTDNYEALNARANRQMKVLEGNWKKAEAEIYRLDDIFDKCKQLIKNVATTEEEDQSLVALREIFN